MEKYTQHNKNEKETNSTRTRTKVVRETSGGDESFCKKTNKKLSSNQYRRLGFLRESLVEDDCLSVL